VVWRIGQKARAVAALGLRPDLVCLAKQPAGVERGQVNGKTLRENRMGNCLILEAKAGGKDDSTGNESADRRQAPEQIRSRKLIGNGRCDCRCGRRIPLIAALSARLRTSLTDCALSRVTSCITNPPPACPILHPAGEIE